MKVKVGSVYYTVELLDVVQYESDKNYFGLCRYKENKLQILKDLEATRKESVFIHELTHAILDEAGFDNHEEDTANRLGKILHQVIKDNDLYKILEDIKNITGR
jgi:Zn-dependent peptidase ImmA (M78 family)